VARARRVKPDEQLTLVEHLDELRSRIIVVLAVLTVGIAVCFYKSEAILNFLAAPLPVEHARPPRSGLQFLATSPLDGILTSISIAIYSALLLTMPIATYQLYAFVIPAFAEQHHKHLKPLVMMIPALFVCGVIFGWYLVVPPAIDFLVGLQHPTPSTTSCGARTTSNSCC
jgi:sec-independent protein translocase protein TatC